MPGEWLRFPGCGGSQLTKFAPVGTARGLTRRQAEGAGVSGILQRLAKAGILDRVAHGVYRLTGAPPPDYLDSRAAWLQLAPEVPAWERIPEQGVLSHRSAAALHGLGRLPADRHQFPLPERRPRRSDIRFHHRAVRPRRVDRPSRDAGHEAIAHRRRPAGRQERPRGGRTGYCRYPPARLRLAWRVRGRPLRRMPPVPGSGEGMASRSFAGSPTELATRIHLGGYRRRECRPGALPRRTGSRQLVPMPDLGVDDRRSFMPAPA